MFVLLIYEATEKFMTNQIVIRLSKQQSSVGEVPFPAVTICPDLIIPDNFSVIIESLSENSSNSEWVYKWKFQWQMFKNLIFQSWYYWSNRHPLWPELFAIQEHIRSACIHILDFVVLDSIQTVYIWRGKFLAESIQCSVRRHLNEMGNLLHFQSCARGKSSQLQWVNFIASFIIKLIICLFPGPQMISTELLSSTQKIMKIWRINSRGIFCTQEKLWSWNFICLKKTTKTTPFNRLMGSGSSFTTTTSFHRIRVINSFTWKDITRRSKSRLKSTWSMMMWSRCRWSDGTVTCPMRSRWSISKSTRRKTANKNVWVRWWPKLAVAFHSTS